MADGHGGHAVAERPPHLGHHYDTLQQQYSSGKLGMWLFLATEVLLFAGLFCVYTVYRRGHPEVFAWGHQFLDWRLGGVNTLVLIFSSFTMAFAVRCAQLGQQRLLVTMLAITFLCGCGFMGIKAVEYSQKWEHGYLWGRLYNPAGHDEHEEGAEHGAPAATGAHGAAGTQGATGSPAATGAHGVTGAPAAAGAHAVTGSNATTGSHAPATTEGVAGAVAATGAQAPAGTAPSDVRSNLARASLGPAGLAAPRSTADDHHALAPPKNAHWFFGIYFVMTGLHGLHVLVGMIVIAWLIVRSLKGHFGVQYFTPVDLGGLYWHLVDLIWIFLFPLLYLIH